MSAAHPARPSAVSRVGEQASLAARLELPAELVEAVALRVAELLAGQLAAPASPYLDVDEAAAYLRCSRQRVYDLSHAGRLRPHRDGRRLLFTRDVLDAALDSPEVAE